ncbi:MAG: hypothetical protein MRJ94_10085 [Nitrospirales bacterium]|nr:hypothetical protein [Nitrospirales bacterium]
MGDVCRQRGVAEATVDVWKKKYAHLGMSALGGASGNRRKNGRLKRLVADLSLDKSYAIGSLTEKSLRPARRRA